MYAQYKILYAYKNKIFGHIRRLIAMAMIGNKFFIEHLAGALFNLIMSQWLGDTIPTYIYIAHKEAHKQAHTQKGYPLSIDDKSLNFWPFFFIFHNFWFFGILSLDAGILQRIEIKKISKIFTKFVTNRRKFQTQIWFAIS